MQVDINELAGFFSRSSVNVINVVRSVVLPGKKCFGANTPSCSGLIFPLRGQARMSFNGVRYEMEYGKIFHAGPNMAMNKEVVGQAAWDFMIIHYQVEEERDAASYALSDYQLDPGHNTRINDMLNRLYQTCAAPGSLPALRARTLFFNILEESLTCTGNRRSDSGRELVEQAKDYMKTHYMEPLTMPKLAGYFGLNTKQLAYLFQKHAGIGPNEYLIEYRMQHARELLRTTVCSVAEISACVGYSDPYYFSKLFKKRTGCSPSRLQSRRENIRTDLQQ